MSKRLILSRGHFFCGFIVRMKSKKTIGIRIKRLVQHRKYKKVLLKYTNILVHNENFFCSVGDKVLIKECSPISKMKSFLIVDILCKSVNL